MPAVTDATPPPRPAKDPESWEAAKQVPQTPAPPTGDRPHNTYVKNFNAEVDNQKLHDMFKAFGTIPSCAVLYDRSGRSKQVGFVQFTSDAEANAAVEEMNGKTGFGSKPLHVARTNKKPIPNPNRRRFGMGWYHYEQAYTPLRQPMYASYPMPSPTSPPTTTHSPQSSSAHSYPSGMPGWPHAGAVQIVYVPYNPYLYNKQAKGSSGYQTDSRTGSIPSGHSGSPSGLYTGPPQYEAYHPSYGPYMPGPSSQYNPYYTSNNYPGYAAAGWGSPYYQYSNVAPSAGYAY